jgi:enamine deaminase RidA (YjgF/YER057c/UK114 family)
VAGHWGSLGFGIVCAIRAFDAAIAFRRARVESPAVATIEKFGAAGVYESPLYSQGVKVAQAQTILFLSGQVAYTPEGGAACRGDFAGQARMAYQAIQALVESQGGTLASVVKLTTFVTDMRYRPDLAPVREAFFGKKGPASTLVEVSALAHPDWLIEIEAIAVL